MIQGNKDEISKAGKIFKSMCKDTGLCILNAHTKCQGKWTRVEKDKKSVLDYALIRREDELVLDLVGAFGVHCMIKKVINLFSIYRCVKS